jgi:hypothetical protein
VNELFKQIDINKKKRAALDNIKHFIPGQKHETVFTVNQEKLKEGVNKAREEIELIQSGCGETTNKGFHDAKKTPTYLSLRLVEVRPSPEVMTRFYKLAKQDFGINTSKRFEEWFKGAVECQTKKN